MVVIIISCRGYDGNEEFDFFIHSCVAPTGIASAQNISSYMLRKPSSISYSGVPIRLFFAFEMYTNE
jgi:hypothetical protein